MLLKPISLQPWGYGTFCSCYKILEVDRISKMIFWDEPVFYLVFALRGMRIIQLPLSSHGYQLWFGAISLVSHWYFIAILCIPAHIISSQNEWALPAFGERDICIPQTCLWQIGSLWMRFVSFFHTSFTLIFCLWVLLSRSFLWRLGEF